MLNTTLGSTIRFIVWGTGTEADIHFPSVDGQAVLAPGSARAGMDRAAARTRTAGVAVMPGTAAVVDMVALSPGNWSVRCGTLDHAGMGMVAKLAVLA